VYRATLVTLLLLLCSVWAVPGQKSDRFEISVQGGGPVQDANETKVQPGQPLTNDSIIKVVKAGLSDETITTIVRTQPGKYSLGPDDIIALKKARVSEKIITAMLNNPPSGTPTAAVPPPALPEKQAQAADPAVTAPVPHGPGTHQDRPEGESGGWQCSREQDDLHSSTYESFALIGTYVQAPSSPTDEHPMLEVECSGGKFKGAGLSTGVVLGGNVTDLAFVAMRWDNEKYPHVEGWERSSNPTILLLNRMQLGKFMTGHRPDRKGDLSPLVHRQIIGVEEALAGQIVIQFDIPQDSQQMLRACGFSLGGQ
jgi:hypothetical protein